MSLSISDSNPSYKKRTMYLLILCLVFYILANILGYLYNRYIWKVYANSYIFQGGVEGNYSLMKAMFKGVTPDVIFIGNSITTLHINTYFFHHNGIKSFNYATAGYFIGQYPTMVENAIRLKPKMIAISVLLEDFYLPSSYYFEHYNHNDDFTYANLDFLVKHTNRDARSMLFHFLMSYLVNCNFFIENGYLISRDIATKFEKFQAFRLFHAFFPRRRKQEALPDRLTFECRFDDKGNHHPTVCYNGDFVMIGQKEKLHDYRQKQYLLDKDFNANLVNVFNGLFDRIRQAGIQPVLVLVTSFDQYVVDRSLLQHAIHADIIDLSDIPFANEYFADRVHFNIAGRNVYSRMLVNELKPFIA